MTKRKHSKYLMNIFTETESSMKIQYECSIKMAIGFISWIVGKSYHGLMKPHLNAYSAHILTFPNAFRLKKLPKRAVSDFRLLRKVPISDFGNGTRKQAKSISMKYGRLSLVTHEKSWSPYPLKHGIN